MGNSTQDVKYTTVAVLHRIVNCVNKSASYYVIFEYREYWVVYRGLGFLADVLFGSSPTPTPSHVSNRRPVTHSNSKKDKQVADRRRGEGVRGALESQVLNISYA